MKQALISPTETNQGLWRVAEVAAQSFPVASPLFWTACADNITALYWYNPQNQAFQLLSPVPPTAEQNKQQAMTLLQQTDWVVLSDVDNPTLNPHLLNKAAFISYREALRQIAVYPTAGDLEWPTKPTEQWSQ